MQSKLSGPVNAASWKIKPGGIGIEIRNSPNIFNLEIAHVDVPCAVRKKACLFVDVNLG